LDRDPTDADRSLIKQAAAIALQVERRQERIVKGEDVAADEVIRLSSEHRRTLGSLKGAKSKREQPNHLLEYLSEKYGLDEPEPEAEGA
jgi:hypothetical protein